MKKWRVCGITTINLYVDVEAETLEEAIDIADSDVSLSEYIDGSIGAEYSEAENVDITENGWFEWQAEYSELIEDDEKE